jgi:hypothetical protein
MCTRQAFVLKNKSTCVCKWRLFVTTMLFVKLNTLTCRKNKFNRGSL